jgi:hypothetical protein
VILGHLAVSALLHRYLVDELDPGGLAPAMTAGLFPDVVDKLLCQVLHVTPSGRMYGHTLLGAALSTLLVRKVWGARAAWAWALGYLGHLAADMDGFVPWLYPFREYDFEGEDIGLFRIVRRAIRNPIRMGVESALLIWAVFALVGRPRSAHQQNPKSDERKSVHDQ